MSPAPRPFPPGHYVVTAWHETYGTQTKEITVAPALHSPWISLSSPSLDYSQVTQTLLLQRGDISPFSLC